MKKIILLLAVLFIGIGLQAQKSSKELKGDKLYEQFYFIGAIEKYNKVDGLTIDGQRKLALSYKNLYKSKESEEVFTRFIYSKEVIPEDLFNYASILRMNGKYEESNAWMKQFELAAPLDYRAKNYVTSASLLENMLKDQGRYDITELEINSEQQDFGPAYYGDQVVFASSREGYKGIKRTYNWNGLPFLNLYKADVDLGQLSNERFLNKSINNKFHEGPAAFTADGKYMAYTQNNYEGESEDNTVKLQLFFATKNEDEKWETGESFKLNSNEYNIGHPWLSSDGKVMYFSSDMPGGIGGSDIYRITKNEDGTWGEAVNLGSKINSEGGEKFPFYQEDQEVLFFASDGHLGIGGLDLFIAPDAGGGKFSNVLNLGAPMNTRYDDFALIVDNNMRKGYFSSNREGGKGSDDIYSFQLLKPFTFGKTIKGIAKDKQGDVLVSTQVMLYNEEGVAIDSLETAKDGAYSFTVDPDEKFILSGKKANYFDGKNTADTHTEEDVVYADLELEKDPGISLYCLVTDKESGEPLEGVSINFLNNIKGVEEEILTSATGDFMRPLKDNKLNDRISYNIVLEKEGYLAKTVTYNQLLEKEGQYKIHENLDLTMSKMDVGMDLSKFVQINPIYFDYNKYAIRKDAAIELDKVVKVMNENPGMYVELGSHTDCRGSEKYNERLSDKRAKASAKYIASKITTPERIFGKGYGESQLINQCACEGRVKSDCSDEEHQANRRTEFRITKMDSSVKVKNNSPQSFDEEK
jgi:outer membrane protein OmpA-like peptidoglycan-associated protein